MKKHSQEPWFIGLQDPELAESGVMILEKSIVKIFIRDEKVEEGQLTIALIGHQRHNEVDANAKRIVDCVNSMAGIEEPLRLMETFKSTQRVLELMMEQNNLLHKALDITLNPNKHSKEDELQTIMEGIMQSLKMIEEIKKMKP